MGDLLHFLAYCSITLTIDMDTRHDAPSYNSLQACQALPIQYPDEVLTACRYAWQLPRFDSTCRVFLLAVLPLIY